MHKAPTPKQHLAKSARRVRPDRLRRPITASGATRWQAKFWVHGCEEITGSESTTSIEPSHFSTCAPSFINFGLVRNNLGRRLDRLGPCDQLRPRPLPADADSQGVLSGKRDQKAHTHAHNPRSCFWLQQRRARPGPTHRPRENRAPDRTPDNAPSMRRPGHALHLAQTTRRLSRASSQPSVVSREIGGSCPPTLKPRVRPPRISTLKSSPMEVYHFWEWSTAYARAMPLVRFSHLVLRASASPTEAERHEPADHRHLGEVASRIPTHTPQSLARRVIGRRPGLESTHLPLVGKRDSNRPPAQGGWPRRAWRYRAMGAARAHV